MIKWNTSWLTLRHWSNPVILWMIILYPNILSMNYQSCLMIMPSIVFLAVHRSLGIILCYPQSPTCFVLCICHCVMCIIIPYHEKGNECLWWEIVMSLNMKGCPNNIATIHIKLHNRQILNNKLTNMHF